MFQSKEHFFDDQPFRARTFDAGQAEREVVFGDVPPGEYIVTVHHDDNADGRRNTNANGVPTESTAFALPGGSTLLNMSLNEATFAFTNESGRAIATLSAPPAPPQEWGVGVMGIVSDSPYRGADTETKAIPFLSFVGERFTLIGPRAGYNLRRDGPLAVNAVASFEFEEEAFEDSRDLEGMDKRRETVMAGLDASLRFLDRWRMEGSILTDVFGRHDGQEVTVSVTRLFRYPDFFISPGAGLAWHSSDYNNYYFGVDDNEARPGRPPYQPGAGVDAFLQLFARYEISDDWSVVANARLTRLADDVTDSPIVEDDTSLSVLAGLGYTF